jgi:hypothetical protein
MKQLSLTLPQINSPILILHTSSTHVQLTWTMATTNVKYPRFYIPEETQIQSGSDELHKISSCILLAEQNLSIQQSGDFSTSANQPKLTSHLRGVTIYKRWEIINWRKTIVTTFSIMQIYNKSANKNSSLTYWKA